MESKQASFIEMEISCAEVLGISELEDLKVTALVLSLSFSHDTGQIHWNQTVDLFLG